MELGSSSAVQHREQQRDDTANGAIVAHIWSGDDKDDEQRGGNAGGRGGGGGGGIDYSKWDHLPEYSSESDATERDTEEEGEGKEAEREEEHVCSFFGDDLMGDEEEEEEEEGTALSIQADDEEYVPSDPSHWNEEEEKEDNEGDQPQDAIHGQPSSCAADPSASFLGSSACGQAENGEMNRQALLEVMRQAECEMQPAFQACAQHLVQQGIDSSGVDLIHSQTNTQLENYRKMVDSMDTGQFDTPRTLQLRKLTGRWRDEVLWNLEMLTSGSGNSERMQ